MTVSTDMTIEELIAEFDDLGDWESKCEYLIDMGDDVPDMPEALKTDDNKVHGCQSNVWMTAKVCNDAARTVELLADSDAKIVKGLVSVILMAYSGRPAREILGTDIGAIFGRLGLTRHLSMARKNGLTGMVRRVRALAVEALARG